MHPPDRCVTVSGDPWGRPPGLTLPAGPVTQGWAVLCCWGMAAAYFVIGTSAGLCIYADVSLVASTVQTCATHPLKHGVVGALA